jgi:hypothetical protein
VKHITFHHGREYIVYDSLTPEAIKAIQRMGAERHRKLNALSAKSTKKYFEDTDRMVETILRRCFRMTDWQIEQMDQHDRRILAHAFVKFLAATNNLDYQ